MSHVYGADVAELRRLSAEFHAAADELDRDGGLLTRLLNGVDWLGGVATRFTSQWTGVQLPRIGLSTRFLRDAADQLARNADEQEQATRDHTASSPRLVPQPNTRSAPEHADADSETATGALPGAGRSEAEVLAAYRGNYTRYGLPPGGAAGGTNEYQCVSWAWFRMKELGLEQGYMRGDGKDVAGHFGGTTTTKPAAGAVISSPGTERNAYGHVMIAEEVFVDAQGRLSMRVSEMNTGRNDDGGWFRDSVARAEEYYDQRVWTLGPDGRWSDGTSTATLTIANPTYGAPRI